MREKKIQLGLLVARKKSGELVIFPLGLIESEEGYRLVVVMDDEEYKSKPFLSIRESIRYLLNTVAGLMDMTKNGFSLIRVESECAEDADIQRAVTDALDSELRDSHARALASSAWLN